MKRGHVLARLFRALSGMKQQDVARKTGIHLGLLRKYELGQADPSPEHLDRLAEEASLTVEAGERILELVETRRRPRLRVGRGVDDLDDLLVEQISNLVSGFQERLLTLGARAPVPQSGDRERAREQWELLKDLPDDQPYQVITVASELQTWALAERACEELAVAASRDVERALSLGELAVEIARRVQGPEGFPERVQGFAYGHWANALRVAGRFQEAEVFFGEARRLWDAGSDPDGLLDPGRLLDLEASLRRDQGKLEKALALLDEAYAVGRCPGRSLIKKGLTLEALGEYDRALEAFLAAEPLLDRQTAPRLWSNLRFNLAVNYCHLGRCSEAAELTQPLRDAAADLRDEVLLIRVTWLEGHIAAGLGQRDEALKLLQQARREFAGGRMWDDVALTLLEEAALLLEAGRAAECKELARELAGVFEAEGVHREALAALRLFREAAEHEAATAELARRVLDYLFTARYDESFRYGS